MATHGGDNPRERSFRICIQGCDESGDFGSAAKPWWILQIYATDNDVVRRAINGNQKIDDCEIRNRERLAGRRERNKRWWQRQIRL